MEIRYIRQHNDSFMIMEQEAGAGFEYKMIKNNYIPVLLPFKDIGINGRSERWYTISSMQSLQDYIESTTMTPEVLENVIRKIYMAYEQLNKYLINPSHIYLSKETVMVSKDTENISVALCYYPGIDRDMQQQFREIMDFLIKEVSSNNKDLMDVLYRLYEKCLKDDFTLPELLEEIQALNQEDEIKVTKIDMRDQAYNEVLLDEGEAEERPGPEQNEYGGGDYLSDYYEEEPSAFAGLTDTVFGALRGIFKGGNRIKDEDVGSQDFYVEPDIEIGERTVLLTEQKPMGKLVYDGDGREADFIVERDILKIGSLRGNNDATIHSKAVSSAHAKIIREGEDFYIEDLNSSNGTYVNGQLLNYHERHKLNIMDKLRFADVGYIFM